MPARSATSTARANLDVALIIRCFAVRVIGVVSVQVERRRST
jgi:hypothetical protein